MHASEGFTMGPHIDAFCGEICLKLVDIDEELRYLKITIREKARHAEPAVRSHLEKVMKRIACNQSKVAARQFRQARYPRADIRPVPWDRARSGPVLSALGQGATFTAHLPLAEPPREEIRAS
jgi:hypothetical protein